MPEFCNESYKTNVFVLNGDHIVLQLTAAIVTFVEFYVAILSAVHSNVAPVFSVLVAIYALISIYTFFGLKTNKFVNVVSSTFLSLKLSAVALGYLYASLNNGFNNEISFMLMTIILLADGFLGYALLSTRSEFSKEVKNYRFMESGSMTFFFDNWKAQLFRSNEAVLKNFSFILTSVQGVLAFAAIFSFSGYQVITLFL